MPEPTDPPNDGTAGADAPAAMGLSESAVAGEGADIAPETAAPITALRLDSRPLQTAEDVANYLDVSYGQLIYTVYKATEDERYRFFEIPKRTGGMRPIHAPTGLIRTLQDRLLADFKALYRPHPAAHGFIDKRSVATNAADHVGKRWVLNVDLEGFFPAINFGRVRGLFMKAPFEMGAPAATVCAQIVTFRNGLPQGAPTSPILSNFIAAQLDRRLARLARQNRLTYSRYADDITFSTNQPQMPASVVFCEPIEGGGEKISVGDALEHAINACGFEVNPKKVRLQSHHFHQGVTGLTVNDRVNVGRERIRKLRAMLHAWRKFGIEAAAGEHFAKYHPSHGRRTPSNPVAAFRNVLYGHMSFVKMVRGMDDPVFAKLCSQVLQLDPNPAKFIRQMVFGADDYEVFISHASEDKEQVARPVFEACRRAGIKAFLDEKHIGLGESFTSKINTALGASRTVLAVVSSNSATKDWPMEEINTALALEITGEKKVVALMVGNPDLTKLPLLRTKRWISWNGDADAVAAALKEALAPPPEATAAGGGLKPSHPASSVPLTGHRPAHREAAVVAAASASGAWGPSPPSRPAKPKGWFARLFGRR